MPRVRKDDMVEILSGNDRGKRGRILKMVMKKDRVLVQGINLRWKHMRKSQQSPQGGRIKKEIPIHISNVMLVDEATDTATRVGYKVIDGKKRRISRKSGQPIAAAVAGKKAPKKTEKQKEKADKKAGSASPEGRE